MSRYYLGSKSFIKHADLEHPGAIGFAAGAALPSASLLQYLINDLPKNYRLAKHLSYSLPIVSHTNTEALNPYLVKNRIVLQASPPERLRNVIKAYLSERKNLKFPYDKNKSHFRNLVNRLLAEKKLFGETAAKKFDLGYGSTAAAGSPIRHSAVIGANKQLLDYHPVYYPDDIEGLIKKLKTKKGRKSFYRRRMGTDYVVSPFSPKGRPGFSILGDITNPGNASRIEHAAMVQGSLPYEGGQATWAGARNVLLPRFPFNKKDPGKIVCRSGYCSRQIEDAFGLTDLFGGKRQLPAHITYRKDFNPVVIVTKGIRGKGGPQARKVLHEIWKEGIRQNAIRRIGLGAGSILGLGSLGALLLGGGQKTYDVAQNVMRGVGTTVNNRNNLKTWTPPQAQIS